MGRGEDRTDTTHRLRIVQAAITEARVEAPTAAQVEAPTAAPARMVAEDTTEFWLL